MHYRALLMSFLLLSGCGGDESSNAPQPSKQTRIVLLKYRTDMEKEREEARLNLLVAKEGWRIVSTETRSQQVSESNQLTPTPMKSYAEWNVTVTLER